MIFSNICFAGFGSEPAGAVDLCGAQHGDDLLLGDDELASVDEPEGGLVADDKDGNIYSVFMHTHNFLSTLLGATYGGYGSCGSRSSHVLTLEVSHTCRKGGENHHAHHHCHHHLCHHHHHPHHNHHHQLERVLSMAGQYEFAARDSLFSDISETLCNKVV